jgi:hypothetical protein
MNMEKRMIHRKLARVAFWLVILYTAASTTVVWAIQFGWIPVPRTVTASGSRTEQKAPEARPGLEAFAEQFVREYLFWTQGKEESRAERLRPFWKPRLDVQGGLDFSKAKWNSYVRYVSVWDVKERQDGSGVKDVIVYAETILSRADRPQEQKRVDRYMSVPVKEAGSSYVVVDVPHFVPAPVPSYVEEPETGREEYADPVDEATRSEVESFLKSFWKVYTTGEPREIAYFRKDNRPEPGLAGVMAFQDLKNLKAVRKDGEVLANCQVVLEDLASGAQVSVRYDFRLVREGNRWYVLKMEQGEV